MIFVDYPWPHVLQVVYRNKKLPMGLDHRKQSIGSMAKNILAAVKNSKGLPKLCPYPTLWVL